MQGAPDPAAVRALAAPAFRVIDAAQFLHLAVFVQDRLAAGDEKGVAQAHLGAGGKAVEFFGRLQAEVVALNEQLARKGRRAAAVAGVFRVPGHFQLLHPVFRPVLDDHAHRVQHGHGARGHGIEPFAHAVLKQGVFHRGVGAGHADAPAEVAQGLRRHAPAAQTAQGGHARVVPAGHMPLAHQLDELALGKDGIGQIEARELDLLRVIDAQGVQHPVVELAVVDELQRAEGMGDAFEGIGQAVRVIVHGIDAPRGARAVMRLVADAVKRGVAHDKIGGRHVDFRAQHARPVRKLARAHAPEQVQILLHATAPPRALPARLGERAPEGPDLVGGEVVHIGFAPADELLGVVVQALEIVRGVKLPVIPAAAEPGHILADGGHILGLFLDGIGVVKAQIAPAAEFSRHAKVQADGLGMAEMEIAVGLRRKAGMHLAPEAP